MKPAIYLPPHGLIAEIHRQTGYSRTTVTNALRKNAQGTKADKVREIYRKSYLAPNNI